MPRLLVCKDCCTASKLPDYDGPTNDKGEHLYDLALDEVVARHQHPEIPDGQIKGGDLYVVDQATYEHLDFETTFRKELAKNHIEIQAFREELREEATECYIRHKRPEWPGKPCIDWCDESKTIGRKKNIPRDFRQYLCQHCPYASSVVTARRWERGMYN